MKHRRTRKCILTARRREVFRWMNDQLTTKTKGWVTSIHLRAAFPDGFHSSSSAAHFMNTAMADGFVSRVPVPDDYPLKHDDSFGRPLRWIYQLNQKRYFHALKLRGPDEADEVEAPAPVKATKTVHVVEEYSIKLRSAVFELSGGLVVDLGQIREAAQLYKALSDGGVMK